MNLPPVIAFGFGNLAMLAWLAAAAAPLIIHLWNRRKHQEIPWAAMEYLLAAMRKNARRVQIEQWILLALRTLLIALLVTALAEPYLERAGLGFLAGRRVHKVVVIDGSFSMNYQPGDTSRFDRAKELAVRLVEESRQGDGFTLLLLADPPRVVVGAPAFDRQDFVEEVENLRQPHTLGDVPATLEKVEEILTRARHEHPRLESEEIYLFTDMGRTTWLPDATGGPALEAFQCRSQRLSRDARLVLLDVGQPQADNLAIAELRCTEPYATLERDVTFETQVRNLGRQPQSRLRVELLVDDRHAGEAFCDVRPGGEAWVTFRHRFEASGVHAVTARISGDLLAVDNQRRLALPVKQAVRVLCVNGKPAGAPFQGATDYLTVALAPRTQESSLSLIQPEVIPESALLEEDLTRYDVVFLANVGQFTDGEAQVLRGYLAQGGGLAFFLGDQVQAESYNRALWRDGDEQVRVLPCRVGERAAEGRYHLHPLDYRHPLTREFEHQERAGLLSALVWQYQRLELAENSRAKVALAIQETGDPLLVEEPLDRGRVVVVATSGDVSWTSLAAGPAFVPLVQELLALVVSNQQAELNVPVGQAIGGAIRALASDVAISVTRPDGEQESIRSATDAGLNTWNYGETSESGVYQVAFGPPLSRQEVFVVNVDTRESDLTQLDPAELRATVWPGVHFDHRTSWQDLDEPAEGEITRRGGLHRGLLYTVLALLFAELACGWWFGRHR